MSGVIKFKVIFHSSDGVLHSACAGDNAEIIYEPGKVAIVPDYLAKAGYYPLVFNTIKDVINADIRGDVWECLCNKKVTLPARLPYKCFEHGEVLPSPISYDRWPKGTLMYKEVTLIRKLEIASLWGSE